jgi:hypothetical protein
MSSVVLTGDTSGAGTITVPAVAGTFTATIGSATGTHYPFTAGTAVASTSGTSIDFTSIPSWVKRITVLFKGVSTNGTSAVLIQLGATTPVTTGYLGTGTSASSAVASTIYTAGFGVGATTQTAAFTRSGSFVVSNITGNNWACQGAVGQSDAAQTMFSTGAVDVGATLDRIRITTVNGTDTFDAGSINILYE